MMTKAMKATKTAGLDVANKMDNDILATDIFLLNNLIDLMDCKVAHCVQSMMEYQLQPLHSLLIYKFSLVYV